MSTRIRTWLLMAGLTGLLVVTDAEIGGGALFLFAAFAVALNLASSAATTRTARSASTRRRRRWRRRLSLDPR